MRTTLPVSVHLREREIDDGRISLYLDISENGKRRKESLHLYYLSGKDRETRLRNEETRRIAEQKAREMEEDLLAMADGFEREGLGMDLEFFEFFRECINKKKNTNTHNVWQNTYNHVVGYEDDVHIKIKRITPRWIQGFKEYLLEEASSDTRCFKPTEKHLSQNSAALYFRTLISCVNMAKALHYIKRDPTDGIKRISQKEGTRNYLDIEELKKLADTPCHNEVVKRAFLFSCMTGIRFVDISNLKWSNVYKHKESTYIRITQIKTDNEVQIPLNEKAISIIGEEGDLSSLVFEGLPSLAGANRAIASWCKSAGLEKHISYHCSRHTFACLTLLASGDLYTTSKLLGHTNIKTTEIYAKVMDKSKEDAINKLNNML